MSRCLGDTQADEACSNCGSPLHADARGRFCSAKCRDADARHILQAESGGSVEGPNIPENTSGASGERNLHLGNSCGPLDVPPGLSNGLGGRRCEGLDPRDIDLAVLTAAGHGPRPTRSVVGESVRWVGGDVWFDPDRIRRHSQIRHMVCAHCVENMAEVRRCTTFRCPFWPYRMGNNPHRPQRDLTDEERAQIAERLNRARGAA